MGLVLVTAPTVEPILLEEAKDYLRESDEPIPQDTVIEDAIRDARVDCEATTNRALMPQTWRYLLRAFPCGDQPIKLPLPPLQSVSSIVYVDDQGNEVTMDEDDYVADVNGDEDDPICGHVRPVYGGWWPFARDEPNAVRVTFLAGYAGVDAIPGALRRGMLEEVAGFYEHREPMVTGTIVAKLPGTGRERYLAHAVLWRGL